MIISYRSLDCCHGCTEAFLNFVIFVETAVLSNDSLSCLLSSLDVALDDICAGRVHMTSPEEFMTVFDSYKALSLTLFELLSSETARPNQDWLLICNVWKLISTYLCETELGCFVRINGQKFPIVFSKSCFTSMVFVARTTPFCIEGKIGM